jgi:amidase
VSAFQFFSFVRAFEHWRDRALDAVRDRITCLAAHGGLAGHPQVNVPGAVADGAPIGLSILGARGRDATLIAVATALANAA